jgi:hypothetical protein
LRRSPRIKIFALLGAVVISLAAAGCGGGSKDSGNGKDFTSKASADKFAGPTPLSVNFSAQSSHAAGDVLYRWRFDDGTSSTDPTPSHSFARAGYYLVVLDSRDSKGDTHRESLLLGAWPPGQWNKAQKTPPRSKKAALDLQKSQQDRTNKRHEELLVKLRAEARQKAAQTPGT